MEGESEVNEPSITDAENVHRGLKQQPRSVRGTKLDRSLEEIEKITQKASAYDEVDLGHISMDTNDSIEQERGDFSKGRDTLTFREAMSTSMLCQTDINANFISSRDDSTVNAKELIDNDLEVDKKLLANTEIKIMESSFCQTDETLDLLPKFGERNEGTSCKEKENLGILESMIMRHDNKKASRVEGIKVELNKTDTSSYSDEKGTQSTAEKTEILRSEETHREAVEHIQVEGDARKDSEILITEVNIERPLDKIDSQEKLLMTDKSSELQSAVDLTGARVIIDTKEKEGKRNEQHPLEEGILYETAKMDKGENEATSGKTGELLKVVKEFDCSGNLQEPEGVCFEGVSGLPFVGPIVEVEEKEKKENFGVTPDVNVLKEDLRNSNDKEIYGGRENEMQCVSMDGSSSSGASEGVKTIIPKIDDMQKKIDKNLRKEHNEIAGHANEINRGEEMYDCQAIVVQPQIVSNLQAKEQNDSLERQLIGVEKKASITSSMTNEKDGEKDIGLVVLHESGIVSCLAREEEHAEKTNLIGMEEICKKGNELGDTEKGPEEAKSSKLDHDTVQRFQIEKQNSDHNFGKGENEHAFGQVSYVGENEEKIGPRKEVQSRRGIQAKEKKNEIIRAGEGDTTIYKGDESSKLDTTNIDEADSRELIRDQDSEEFLIKNNLKEVESNLVDREDDGIFSQIKNSTRSSTVEKKVWYDDVKVITRDEYQYANDDGMGDAAVGKPAGNTACSHEETNKIGSAENKEEFYELKESEDSIGQTEYEIIDCLTPESQAEDENVRVAIIIRHKEKEMQGRPISVGEPRIISPKHQKQVHFENADKKTTNVSDLNTLDGGDSEEKVAITSISPPHTLALDIANTSLYDSSVEGGSCSPSGASVESEFSLALKEKDKLQSALKAVKNQYEDLLKEFDKIIENNTKESSDENIPISKESYSIALKCKEELEMEIRKAREQLAIVQATHDSLSEDFAWHSSEYEYSEDSESVSFDITEESKDEVRRTSTPLTCGTSLINSSAISKQTHFKDNSIQTDDENIKEIKDAKEKPLLQERGTNTSPESEAGAACGYRERHRSDDLPAMKSTDLQRLPATLPRKRAQKRRPRTLQLDELTQSDAKWVSRKGLVDKEQARKNEKLTLQAIENAELKKELLLTKLEKIRLEAMLSCVMMRVSNADVEDEFRKISINSITSSSSTLRSTTSLTNIAQNDPTSPVSTKYTFAIPVAHSAIFRTKVYC